VDSPVLTVQVIVRAVRHGLFLPSRTPVRRDQAERHRGGGPTDRVGIYVCSESAVYPDPSGVAF
jgi:hypothetical protein